MFHRMDQAVSALAVQAGQAELDPVHLARLFLGSESPRTLGLPPFAPREATKEAGEDDAAPLAFRFPQLREHGADAEPARVAGVDPVDHGADHFAREGLAEPASEERVDRLVAESGGVVMQRRPWSERFEQDRGDHAPDQRSREDGFECGWERGR